MRSRPRASRTFPEHTPAQYEISIETFLHARPQRPVIWPAGSVSRVASGRYLLTSIGSQNRAGVASRKISNLNRSQGRSDHRHEKKIQQDRSAKS
jgi:hypothetical protein